MPLEDMVGPDKFIDSFNILWPLGADSPSEGDDHIRGIKNCLVNWAAGLEASILQKQVAPVGSIITSASKNTPVGHAYCNGAEVSRTDAEFLDLFNEIGTDWGIGDGSTTFNLPDGRGSVWRGQDDGSGKDPDAAGRIPTNGGASGDNVGSAQLDAGQLITGNAGAVYRSSVVNTAGALLYTAYGNTPAVAGTAGTDPGDNVTLDFNSSSSPGARTSTETRMRNNSVRYYIKL